MKYLLSILFIIFTFSNGQKLSDLVEKNEKAIFQILTYDEYGSPNSSGTGFYVNSKGLGFTNVHLFENVSIAYIRDINGNLKRINKINRICEPCDIAEFSVDLNPNESTNFLELTNEIPPKASEIFVIGNPQGFENTVSTGIISSIRDDGNKIIQITAPISPGSSGSPIMDLKGNVIGISTYNYEDGQNLNFGYWIGCQKKLQPTEKIKIRSEQTNNLFIINKVCENNEDLILHSIELNERNTVVNMSFTNTNLAYGDNAFIFTTIGDKSKSFFIQNNSDKEKYYLYNSTLGMSAKSPTFIALGESYRFKLFFPSIGKSESISIFEGMEGSEWSFEDIDLQLYKSIRFEEENYFNNFYLQTGLSLLSKKEFSKAYILLKDFVSEYSDNSFANTLAGIISFVMGNDLDARFYFQKALEINPTESGIYFNLYYINTQIGDYEKALRNISSAITLDPYQPEYIAFRGHTYFEMKLWKEAINDYNLFTDSDRIIPYDVYLQRGISKLLINDINGCQDLKEAYSLADDDGKKFVESIFNEASCE
jgi:serine protease Do